MFEIIVYIGGGIGFIYYGIMPLIIYRETKLLDTRSLRIISEDIFLMERSSKFKALFFEIKENDFKSVACTSFKNQSTYTNSSLFIHPHEKFSVILTEITNSNVPTLLYLEIYQVFDDYTSISIINSPIMGAFPPSSRKITLRFPKVIKVSELITISEDIIQNYLSSKIPIVLTKGQELEMMKQFLEEEQKELIEKGYLQNNNLNLTLKGAYIMTWKMLFPIKQIRNSMDLSFAQKILFNRIL